MENYFSDDFFSNIKSAQITNEDKEDKIPFEWDEEFIFDSDCSIKKKW